MRNLLSVTIIISIVMIGCHQSKVIQADNPVRNTSIQNTNILKKYTVVKIDSLNNVYLIYAKRNDSVYKIASLKQCLENCNQIKVQGEYGLNLQSLFPKNDSIDFTPIKRNLISGHEYYGTSIYMEDWCVWNLYTVTNVKGLCIISGSQ